MPFGRGYKIVLKNGEFRLDFIYYLVVVFYHPWKINFLGKAERLVFFCYTANNSRRYIPLSLSVERVESILNQGDRYSP